MSLEIAIQENTSAIRELIAAIAAGIPTTGAQVAAVVAEHQPKATVGANGASSTRQSSKTAPAAEAAAQEPAAADAAAASVTYEDVKKAILKLSGSKGRDHVVALLKEFGAKNGPELKPEQYADFVAKATA